MTGNINALLERKKKTLTFSFFEILARGRWDIHYNKGDSADLACVAGVKRGRGNLGARKPVGRAREKRKKPPPSSLERGLAP